MLASVHLQLILDRHSLLHYILIHSMISTFGWWLCLGWIYWQKRISWGVWQSGVRQGSFTQSQQSVNVLLLCSLKVCKPQELLKLYPVLGVLLKFWLHVQTMEIKKIWFILFFFYKEEIQRAENRDGLYEQLVSLWYFLQSLSFMFYETVHTSWKQQSIRKQINRAVIWPVWREREKELCLLKMSASPWYTPGTKDRSGR